MPSLDSTADPTYARERTRRVLAGATETRVLTWAVVALLSAGVLLRLVRYLAERSLWLDEAYLAINLMTRSYAELTQTLDYNQGAPIGFLWVERLMLTLFGDSELALRLFPLLVAIGALLLFYRVARDVLGPAALVVAVLLFATMEPFVRYAAEVKQYGVDVAVTAALLYLFVRLVEEGVRNAFTAAALAVAGPAAVFFSHPSAFVLTGVAAAGVTLALLRRDRSSLIRQLAAYGVWLAAFAAAYFVAFQDLDELRETVRGIGSGAGGGLKNLYTIFNAPGGFPRTAVGLGAALALVGVVYLARRRPGLVVLGAATVGSLLVAGYVGMYPVGHRFLLFLLPLAVLFFAEGVDAILREAPRLLAAALLAAVVALIVAPVVGKAAGRLVSPPEVEEIEPLLAEVSRSWEEGDVLVLYPESQYAFRYYQQCEDCSSLTDTANRLWPTSTTAGGQAQHTAAIVSDSPALVVGDHVEPYLDRVDGRSRVWILYTHFFPLTESEVLAEAERRGRAIRCSRGGASILCLYDFTG